MIRKALSNLSSSGSMGRAMNYALEKAALIGGSQEKFKNTSVKDFVKLGVKKCNQVNNKYENKSGRKQENIGMHEMISFDAADNITPEQAAELALGVWREVLDIDNRQHRWGVHTDTDQIHVHLVWNKRDNAGKIYNQKNDYELFEKALHKTEMANGLKVVENRKFLKPDMPTNPQSSNEWRYEKKGKKSEKTLFKEAVAEATDKAVTAGEFLEFLDRDGYTLITNGNNAYSLEKDGQIFKASEIGASYKLLKARFGDDPAFSGTLARLGVKTAPEREMGGISFDMYVTQADLDKYEDKKKKSNRVLNTRFETNDGHNFFFKNTNKKAFEYDARRSCVDFNYNNAVTIKAGLQKLIEDTRKPTKFSLFGSDAIKREMWLQFHLMGLDKKGHTVTGYSPSLADKAKLAGGLESQKSNNNGHGNDNSGLISSLTKTDVEIYVPPKVDDVPGSSEGNFTGNSSQAFTADNSISAGVLEEKLSEMRSLDSQLKQSSEKQSSDAVAPLKRKLKPRPD